jgi:hypothetical protein
MAWDGKKMPDAFAISATSAAAAAANGAKNAAYLNHIRTAIGSNFLMELLRNDVIVWSATASGLLTITGSRFVLPTAFTQTAITAADIATGEWIVRIRSATDATKYLAGKVTPTAGIGPFRLSASLAGGGTLSMGTVEFASPSFDSTGGGGGGGFGAFKVFDSLFITGKTAIHTTYGLQRMSQHNGDQGWGLSTGQGTPAPSQSEMNAAIAATNAIIPFSGNDGYHFLDWEGFWQLYPWSGDPDGGPWTNSYDSADKFSLSAKRHRIALNASAFASQKFGFYQLPIDSYWAFNGDTAKMAGVTATAERFASQGFAVSGVDFIALSHYSYYDLSVTANLNGWTNHITGAVALARSKFPGIPIYVFLWPRYHDSAPAPFSRLPTTIWRHQLDTAHDLTDGVILWDSSFGSWSSTWNSSDAWWLETIDWMQDNNLGIYA